MRDRHGVVIERGQRVVLPASLIGDLLTAEVIEASPILSGNNQQVETIRLLIDVVVGNPVQSPTVNGIAVVQASQKGAETTNPKLEVVRQ